MAQQNNLGCSCMQRQMETCNRISMQLFRSKEKISHFNSNLSKLQLFLNMSDCDFITTEQVNAAVCNWQRVTSDLQRMISKYQLQQSSILVPVTSSSTSEVVVSEDESEHCVESHEEAAARVLGVVFKHELLQKSEEQIIPRSVEVSVEDDYTTTSNMNQSSSSAASSVSAPKRKVSLTI